MADRFLNHLLREYSSDVQLYIRNQYRLYNHKYFNGQLPNIPIRFRKLKSLVAMVKTKIYRSTKEIVDGEMVFSTLYDLSLERLEGVLLHEMIHVELIYIYKDFKENHGFRFMSRLKELERISGIKIPVSEEISDLEYSKDSKKEYCIVASQNTNLMWLVSQASFKKLQPIENYLSDIYEKFRRTTKFSAGHDLKIYSHFGILYVNMAIARDPRNPTTAMYRITPKIQQILQKEAKLVAELPASMTRAA